MVRRRKNGRAKGLKNDVLFVRNLLIVSDMVVFDRPRKRSKFEVKLKVFNDQN